MLYENGVKKTMSFGTPFLMPWLSDLSSANVEFTRKVCLLGEASDVTQKQFMMLRIYAA
jgi:hypothetical protein